MPGEAEARKIVAAMKETSLYTGNTDAIAWSLASVSENLCVQLSMPKKTPTTRTINRHRQENNMNNLPVLPHSKRVEVPEEIIDFLIYDSGTENSERLLIFGQPTLLELLESTQHLRLADGTFQLSPEIFFQLFTIHTSINGYNPPCIYALPPIKRQKTYEQLLIAVGNALQKIFTDATLSGCYFHLCQSFVRKINEVGLKPVYEQNPSLALYLRMIPALAFLPLEEIEPVFDLVVEEITGEAELLSLEEDVLEKIDLLASYFYKTYLGHNFGSRHRPSVFQLVIWNQSVSAIDGVARTNNATEGWHYGLHALFQGSYPNFWTFLRLLKKVFF